MAARRVDRGRRPVGWCASLILIWTAVTPPVSAQIHDIRKFLDRCPQSDPAYEQIRADFQIRRRGVIADVPPCTEPVSSMATSAYTDVLIAMQGLRVIYYMDRDIRGHLPWTSGSLYDWMKSKIGGIDILPGSGAFCCEYFGPPPDVPPPPPPGQPPPTPGPPNPSNPKYVFIAVGEEDDFNRDFDKKWIGIAGNIDLYAHEVRHVDGFPHSSCCGIFNGCDDTFDPANLSPYGVQWWLNKLWLDGTINVGEACMPPLERQEAVNWFMAGLNSQYASRFCSDRPAAVTAPSMPGGPCRDVTRRRAVARR